MRASWNGYLRLADVVIPMRLYSGTKSVSPHFVQVHVEDHSPVTRVTKYMKGSQELSEDEIARAVEHGGTYVELSDSEIQASGIPDKNITIRQFAELGEVNPIYFIKPYFMVPGKGGERVYTLLRQAFHETKKIAIVTFAMHEKAHLGMIMPHDGMLILQQLRFASELTPRTNIKTPTLPQPAPDELDIALKLMKRYSTSFYIEDYRNEQLDKLNEIIDRKSKGLRPKRQPRITSHTTPEDELVPKLQALAAGKSDKLSTT